MPNRRLFLATLVAAAAFTAQPAGAQGNGNGNGNGGGGNGNGGSGNGGNGGGGNGNGGNGNGGGNGNSAGTESETGAAAPDEGANAASGLSLRHGNGFEEEIDAGRYEMRDNRGRRIVNRAARTADYLRLYRLIGR